MSTVPKSAPVDERPVGEPPPLSASPPAAIVAPSVRFAALQSHNFRLLWFGLLISNAGTWMESTASGWLVTDLEPSHAPFWLGLMAAAFAIPMLVLPPFGGVIADRFPRMRMLWIVQSLYLVLSAMLTIAVLSHNVTIWMLIAYSFANGIVLAFDSPVRHSMLPDIVTREQLTSGVSLNSVAFTGAGLLGPALAGILIPIVGVGGVMTVNTFSCLATLYALSRMTNVPSRRTAQAVATSVFASIGHAVVYIRSSAMLSGLVLLSAISGLTGRFYGPLLAVFARDEFHVGIDRVRLHGLGRRSGHAGRRVRPGRDAGSQSERPADHDRSADTGCAALRLRDLPVVRALVAVAGRNWRGQRGERRVDCDLDPAGSPERVARAGHESLSLTVVGLPSVGAFIFGTFAESVGVREAVAVAAVLFLVLSSALLMRNESVRRAV